MTRYLILVPLFSIANQEVAVYNEHEMNIFSLVFGKDTECLAQKFKGFETRPQQIQMVKAIQNALSSKRHLLVEAGTGVGKSLAYLLPIIKWTKDNNKKAVISTYTKTLQEQLVKKDIPSLKKMLNIDFRFALSLGSQNYLCLRRLSQNNKRELFESEKERRDISKIYEWHKSTRTGLRSDIEDAVNETIWNKVCREGEICLGKKCLFKKGCFYYKARLEEYKAQILITNHHLFFAHVASGYNVLPCFDTVIFDEAHTLEDVATGYLGIAVSNFQIKYFCDTLFNPQTEKGFIYSLRWISTKRIGEIKEKIDRVKNFSELFFSDVTAKFGAESKTIRIKEKGLISNYLDEPLSKLADLLSEFLYRAENDEEEMELKSFISRARLLNTTLNKILYMREEGYVYWLEILNRSRGIKYTFFAAPIDISEEFRTKILDKITPVMLTSATISVNRSFEFIKKNLGIPEESDSLTLNSPFNYKENVLLYLSKNMPDPSLDAELYQEKAIAEIKQIVSIMRGRTFVLFTSFKMMEKTYNALKQSFHDISFLKQTEAPRFKLLQLFKSNRNSVLLGTNTFWQGIDVPGKALECIIISKLPFAVPDEPIVEAKMEQLILRNRNPFIDYQIPRAVIMFRQGFGRLIRTGQDRGMVAVVDPRIMSRSYGKKFLSALPECEITSNLDCARKFNK